jgi:hypothetical protein
MPANEMATSTLTPLAGKLTAVAAADIPLNKLKQPVDMTETSQKTSPAMA